MNKTLVSVDYTTGPIDWSYYFGKKMLTKATQKSVGS